MCGTAFIWCKIQKHLKKSKMSVYRPAPVDVHLGHDGLASCPTVTCFFCQGQEAIETARWLKSNLTKYMINVLYCTYIQIDI